MRNNNIVAPQTFVFDPSTFESLLSFGLPFFVLPATDTLPTLVIQLTHIKLIEIADGGQMKIFFSDGPPLNLSDVQSQSLAEKIQKIADGLRSKIVGFPAQSQSRIFQ